MANLRIGWRNIFDVATLTASPALVTTLPETNLQKQERFKTARSTSLASQDWKASWSSAQRFNYVFMRMHNFTAAAQQRTRTYTDSAFTTGLVDNVAANCFGYTGFSVNDVLTEADFRLLKNSARYLSLITNLQSLNLTTTDAANPDGHMEISRLFGGEYFEMSYNIPYSDAQFLFEDFSTQSRVYDGSVISDKGAKGRKILLRNELCAPADWNALLSGLRSVGKDKDFFISILPENGTYLEAYFQGLVKVADAGMFDRHFVGIARLPITLIES